MTPARALYDALLAGSIDVDGADVALSDIVTVVGFESGMRKADSNTESTAAGNPRDKIMVNVSSVNHEPGESRGAGEWLCGLSVEIESQTTAGRLHKLVVWVANWARENPNAPATVDSLGWDSLVEESIGVNLDDAGKGRVVADIEFSFRVKYRGGRHVFESA